jgi:biopolymer transport protein ExbD
MAAPKKRRIPVVIDMTPMVDIAFLLLIFFMSTTVFKKPEEVGVQLPLSHSVRKLPETGVIVITVTKDGTTLLSLENAALDYHKGLSAQNAEGKLVGNRYTAEQVPDKIKELMVKNPGMVQRVIIKGDKTAKYGAVESIMKALQDNDLNIVNFLTDLKADMPGQAATANAAAH